MLSPSLEDKTPHPDHELANDNGNGYGNDSVQAHIGRNLLRALVEEGKLPVGVPSQTQISHTSDGL